MNHQGFKVAVQDLRAAAKGPLQDLYELSWDCIHQCGGFVEHPGPVGEDDAGLGALMTAYGEANGAFADRQRKGADKIEATRRALEAVATVYAKADGRE